MGWANQEISDYNFVRQFSPVAALMVLREYKRKVQLEINQNKNRNR